MSDLSRATSWNIIPLFVLASDLEIHLSTCNTGSQPDPIIVQCCKEQFSSSLEAVQLKRLFRFVAIHGSAGLLVMSILVSNGTIQLISFQFSQAALADYINS